MHVALINQFYPPARAPTGKLLRDLACALRDAGHDVTVITSAGLYGVEAVCAHPDEPGIHVRRLGPARSHQSGLAAKFLDYARFFPRALAALASMSPPPDVIVTMTTPPFCGLAARRYGRKHGVPYFLWCMDLYPEAMSANRMLAPRNPLYRILLSAARKERVDAARVISLGTDMSDCIRANAPVARIDEVPVWSHLEATAENEAKARALRRERGWGDDEVVLLYSGNIGRAHRVEEFAALVKAVGAKERPIRIVFSGTGPMRKDWEVRLGSRVSWIHPVDEKDAAVHLLSADVHLISQQPEWTGVVVPSKYQAACALGRPVIFAGDRVSAVARWIQQADSGWYMDPAGSTTGVDELVHQVCDESARRQKGRNAHAQSMQLFNADASKRRLVALIEDAVGHRS